MATTFEELMLHQPDWDEIWLPKAFSGPPPGPLLFWDDPPWHYLDPSQSLPIAKAIAECGVAVAGLSVQWRREGGDEDWWGDAGPKIAIVGSERFGLEYEDLTQSDWIDVRLGHRRAADATPTWKAAELARLGIKIEAEQAIALGLPAECSDISEVAHTLRWLRHVSKPETLISLSTAAIQFEAVLSVIEGFFHDRRPSGPALPIVDAVIVRGQTATGTPSEWWQAAMPWKQRLREISPPPADGSATSDSNHAISLYAAPREVEPEEAVRLWLGGVDGVAIDAWCDPLIWDAATANRDAWAARMRSEVVPKIERVRGLARYQRRPT